MNRRLLFWFSITLLLLSSTVLVSGVFESEPVTDGLDDGLDYNVFYIDGVEIPAPLIFDAVDAGVSMDGSVLSLQIGFNIPVPSDAPYSIQIALDSDQSTGTGLTDPSWYYNGLGVDYLIEIEYNGVETTGTVSGYSGGVWVETGVPDVLVVGSMITVSVDHLSIGESKGSSVMVYVIEVIAIDTIPDKGDPPITFIIVDEPLPEPTPVSYEFHYPALVEEGTQFELEAVVDPLDPALEPYTYEWDMDGDGVYEVSSVNPNLSYTFPQDGEYPVSLRVTDASGISGEVTKTVSVQNTPPYDAQITMEHTIEIDETLTLTGTANDKGNDQLTYNWDIAGETRTGSSVSISFTTTGEKPITLTVSDPEGGTTQVTDVVNVNEPEQPEPEPPIDPWLILLIFLFGFAGFFIYNMIKLKEGEKEKPKEPEKKKGFCEEHPEIVEEENQKCWDAQVDLESTIGDIQDQLDDYRDQWRADIRDVSRTIMEWDIAYAMIQSLTQSEEEIRKDSETVQKIAGLVTTGGGMGKTAFKEGGEAAMVEVGKYMASEAGKNIASGLSSTVNDVLSLETWAYTEIGTGIARLLTGEDPRGEASRIRENALEIITQLQSWVDHTMARTTRYTSRTLHTCIDEAQQLMDAIGKAIDDFENAIAGFRCVDCEIPDHILDEMDDMIKELEDFIKTFGDLIDQVEQRLQQAAALLARKDVYDSPTSWLHAQNNEVPNIQRSLDRSAEAKQE